MKLYYYLEGKEKVGPLTEEQLLTEEINLDTLIWTEGLENWIPLKNIPDLTNRVLKAPPPIPSLEGVKHDFIKHSDQNEDKTHLNNNNETLNNSKAEVIFAKETKYLFQKLFIGVIIGAIIGIISFFIYYYKVYDAPRYDNFDFSQIKIMGNITYNTPDLTDYPYPIYQGDDYQLHAKNRKEYFTKKSASNAFIIFLISTGVFIVIIYVSKGTKWINETAKKDL